MMFAVTALARAPTTRRRARATNLRAPGALSRSSSLARESGIAASLSKPWTGLGVAVRQADGRRAAGVARDARPCHRWRGLHRLELRPPRPALAVWGRGHVLPGPGAVWRRRHDGPRPAVAQ